MFQIKTVETKKTIYFFGYFYRQWKL